MADVNFSPREWQLAYRVALRVLKAPDQAEDAAQEALLHAFAARRSFRGDARTRSWLYRIAFNTAVSHLRRPFSRRWSSEEDVERVLDEPARGAPARPSPESLAIASELAGCLEQCMSSLRPLDRLAFTERFLLGTTEKELGQILGVSTNAAKQRAFRARRTVRSCLGASERSGTKECPCASR